MGWCTAARFSQGEVMPQTAQKEGLSGGLGGRGGENAESRFCRYK